MVVSLCDYRRRRRVRAVTTAAEQERAAARNLGYDERRNCSNAVPRDIQSAPALVWAPTNDPEFAPRDWNGDDAA